MNARGYAGIALFASSLLLALVGACLYFGQTDTLYASSEIIAGTYKNSPIENESYFQDTDYVTSGDRYFKDPLGFSDSAITHGGKFSEALHFGAVANSSGLFPEKTFAL